MAYVFNPDGTVDFIEEKIDSYGNIKPIGSPDLLEQTNKSAINFSNQPAPKPKKKRKKAKRNDYYSKETNTKVIIKIRTVDEPNPEPEIKTRITTRQSIENFFNRKRTHRQPVTGEEVFKAKSELKDNLLEFFMQQYEQYNEYCRTMGWGQNTSTTNRSVNCHRKVNSFANES